MAVAIRNLPLVIRNFERPFGALFCRTAWTPEGQKTGLKPTMTRITKSFVCQRRVQIWRDGIFGGLGLHPHINRFGDYVLDFHRKVEALDEGFRILEIESPSQTE